MAYKSAIVVITFLSQIGMASAAPDNDLLAIEDLAEPDPIVLERTMSLQNDIYLGSMELQYSQILDQLCATKHPPKRCHDNDQEFSAPIERSEIPQFQNPEINSDVRLLEVIGGDKKFSAILLISGRQINVRTHDKIPGVGSVARITRRQIQIFDGAQMNTYTAD